MSLARDDIEPDALDMEPIEGVRFLNDDEARAAYDKEARRLLGISGDEFLRRYDAGEYKRPLTDREARGVMKMRMIEDLVR
jgi:hypothetical protein